MELSLGFALGLRPLDRLQVNNRREIEEMWVGRRMNGHADLPFLFFQRVLEDGRLEVRGPGGYVTAVSPYDVCDVIQGEPILVRAMTERTFLERLKSGALASYADAYVLYANKDRWGRPDFYVWFVEQQNNSTGRPWRGMLVDEDRDRIVSRARRTVMPVYDGRGSNHSADFGCERTASYNRDVAKLLITSALKGRASAVSALSIAGIRPFAQASLNKLAA